MTKSNKKNKSNVIGILLLLISILVFLYFYIYIYKVHVKAQEDLRAVKKLNSMMLLPTDETPTVATITDPLRLNSQPFFRNSKAGDKVIIYTKIRKAILFRPSTSKIIEVAPVVSQ